MSETKGEVIKEDGLGIVGREVCKKCSCEEDERGKKRIRRKVVPKVKWVCVEKRKWRGSRWKMDPNERWVSGEVIRRW
jgi:hypothetical protein